MVSCVSFCSSISCWFQTPQKIAAFFLNFLGKKGVMEHNLYSTSLVFITLWTSHMDEAQIGVWFLVLPHISGLPVCSDFGSNHEQPSIPILSLVFSVTASSGIRLLLRHTVWHLQGFWAQPFHSWQLMEIHIPTCVHPSTDGVSSHTHMKVHCGEPKEKNRKANLPIGWYSGTRPLVGLFLFRIHFHYMQLQKFQMGHRQSRHAEPSQSLFLKQL